VLAIWNVGPVNASQIKKFRKRFLVEPAPLWASSYTHLLYKAQDPFSHEDSACSETSSYFSPFLWDQVYASQIKKLRKRFLVEPASLWPSSYTHLLYKLKIHSVHTDSPIVPKQFFLLSWAGNLDEEPVYASQIKKLRKSFLVEPAPLWASSYTHLLYKAHNPFSA